jgi:DivIVA domain-containing protein
MDVTPQELRSSEIKDSWRGYDRDEVDDLLERAAVTIEGLTHKLQDVANRPVPSAAAGAAPAQADVPLPSSREDADMLQRTLLLAQRAADDAVNEAQARARQLLDESEAKAQSLVSDAETTARRIAEGERRRLEAEILDLSSRREQLRTDADALDAYTTGYRDRIRAAIEADLENLGSTVEPPSPRPEIHDIDLPPERDAAPAFADTAAEPVLDPEAEEAVHEVQSDQSAWDPGSETRALGAVDAPSGAPSGSGSPFAAEASASPSPVAAPPRPMAMPASAPAGEWPPAPSPEASAPAAPRGESTWLSAEEEWAPAGEAWDAPAPWERDTAQHEAFATEVPMEANPVDTDSLDDDAFFASLREAVRDDAPLGPRDEDPTFYDVNAEQDRRRFRRRR